MDAATTTSIASTDSNNAPKKRSRFARFRNTLLVILIIVLGFSIYWFYFNKYAIGERTGILVKITLKGNIFKTEEGEMWLSCRQMTNPEKFYFSVQSDSLAQLLRDLQDDCVQLTYTQYRAVLPWRGGTKYIVTNVRPVK